MNELKGSEFLLQIEDPGNEGTFLTLGGLKTKSLTLNSEEVDITNHGSNHWREILEGAGIQNIEASGEGVAQKVQTLKLLLSSFMNNLHPNIRLVTTLGDENVLQITGAFKISSLELSGENDKEVPYSVSFLSAVKPDVQIF